ncbi:MAG: hypothetical protein K8R92_02465 [Planctomycetes bacterium]|nr:hypothetical protein [Planctomycetota bacterium]
MHDSPLRLLTLWLCLVSFLLNGTTLCSGLVICDDGKGNTHIEWGCERSNDGDCRKVCTNESECTEGESDHAPAPCSDTPVNPDVTIARALTHGPQDFSLVATPVEFAIPVAIQEPSACNKHLSSLPVPVRPPDALAQLRCVILVV